MAFPNPPTERGRDRVPRAAVHLRRRRGEPAAAVGTEVAYSNDPDGTNLEIIAPKGGFSRE
ncbi:hypothetical protein [Micromonospora sp. NPDC005203]|uniref:hypothetical protein n=1 Tax=Micromonospora sp. NPDC005203 TaxID=3364226 RepID=UPI00367C8D59